jgi:hypothetical protein
LRSYVLDEQGHLRANVVIFIDGQRTRERQRLDDALQPILRCTFCKPYQEADMSDCAYLATRKGLSELLRTAGAWQLGASHFLGDPVSMLLADRRDGTLYAALHLGHFGPKLHRRMAGCSEWTEVAVPAFPVKPADSADPVEWKVLQIWSLAAGGPDQPGVLWAGTPPGGLFRSDDYGTSWQLVEALWQVPGARSGWAAATTCPASTASASIRAIVTPCWWASPAAARG